MREYDAVIVGSGPNGLGAAIVLARAGLSVLVCEAKATLGGGARTEALTLPGYLHDICSAIHPLGVGSPFFRTLPLTQFGLQWIEPPVALAHPLDDGSAAMLVRSLDETVRSFGVDGPAYRRLVSPFVERWAALAEDILGPLPIPPRHPILMSRFGLVALPPARLLATTCFKQARTRGLFAGLAAHSFVPLEYTATASFGLVLAILSHALNWPIPRGGAGEIARAMAAYLESLGGKIETNRPIAALSDLPSARTVLLDVSPRQFLNIVGERLPNAYREALGRYRYGPGIFKIDWALSGSVPWTAPECRQAGTVHLGGTLEEIARGERRSWYGQTPDRPLVLFAQQSLFDPTRAPNGKQTGWAYCHVPNGSTVDMTEAIEQQVERFAPGFRDLILARHTINTAQLQVHNPNMIGGDINGGVQDIWQLFTRPMLRANPYTTPIDGVFLCSASTPPGGGVHGMCGYHAAQAALQYLKRW
jgi:phytoene dehydrogenase-like protein